MDRGERERKKREEERMERGISTGPSGLMGGRGKEKREEGGRAGHVR